MTKLIEREPVVLANTLHARPHSPLASVFAVLNRIETSSRILVWYTPLPPNSEPRVELPRLGLSFTEGVQGKVRRLSSIDHA